MRKNDYGVNKRVVVTPDKHFPLHDKKAISVVCQAIEFVNPDAYIDLGDTGEWELFSRHYWKNKEKPPLEVLIPMLNKEVKLVNKGMDIIDEDIATLILMRKLHTLLQRITIAFPWFKDVDDKAKSVVINMCYQMGLSGFSKFKKTIYYLETEQYQEAATECLDSLWAKQTPNRAKAVSEAISSAATD